MKNPVIEVRLLSFTNVTDSVGVMTFASQVYDGCAKRVESDTWCVRCAVVKDGTIGSNYVVTHCETSELKPMLGKTETHFGIDADARAALAVFRSL